MSDSPEQPFVPVIIGGYLRTGTTLVQSILCAGPDTNPHIGEAIFLRGILENYWRCAGLFDGYSRYYFDDWEDLRRFCAEGLEAFLARTHTRYGRPRFLVLKHPQLTPNFPLLHELAPRAKLIVVVRDPLDTVASAVAVQRRGAGEFGRASPGDIAASLVSYYRACLGCQSPSFRRQTLYLRYEHLVRDPAPTLTALAKFTGIDLSGADPRQSPWLSTDAAMRQRGQPFDPDHTSYSEGYGKPLTSWRIGRYAAVLSAEDQQAVKEACQPIATFLAYDKPTFFAE